MIAWLKKTRQTRTKVTSAAAMEQERMEGLELAVRTVSAIVLALQLLCWLTLFCYDSRQEASWQSALLAILPMAALLVLWRFSTKRPIEGSRKWILLLLIPNLMLDLFVCMLCSASLLENFIPTFPTYGRILVVTLFPLATLWLSRQKGAAYGIYPLRYLLIVMFAISTVFSGADIQPRRLALTLPGAEVLKTGLLSGAGAVWPVCLLFILPLSVAGSGKKKTHSLFWLIPVVLFLSWALWMSMLHPWQYGDELLPGQKLTAISQYSSNMVVNQLGKLFWTCILPAGIVGSLFAGQEILCHAMPKPPRFLWSLVLILPAAVLLCLPKQWVLGWMQWILPIRWTTAFLAGGALVIIKGKVQTA